MRRYLKRMKAGYRRTASSLAHKQDPAKVARAEAVLAHLKAKAAAGELRLCYLDECGFAPSLPIGYSWSLPGQRSPSRMSIRRAGGRPGGRAGRLSKGWRPPCPCRGSATSTGAAGSESAVGEVMAVHTGWRSQSRTVEKMTSDGHLAMVFLGQTLAISLRTATIPEVSDPAAF